MAYSRARSSLVPADLDANQTDDRCDAIAVRGQILKGLITRNGEVHLHPTCHLCQVFIRYPELCGGVGKRLKHGAVRVAVTGAHQPVVYRPDLVGLLIEGQIVI